MKLLGEYTTKHAERYEPNDEEQAVDKPPVLNQNLVELLSTIQVITDFITNETVQLYQSIFSFLTNKFMYIDYDILENEEVIRPKKRARKNFGLFVLSSPSVLSLLAVLSTGIIILSIVVGGFYLGKNLEPPVNVLVIAGAWFGSWKLCKAWNTIYQAFEIRVQNSLKDLKTPLPHPENSPFSHVDHSTTVNISTSQQTINNFQLFEKGIIERKKQDEPLAVVKENLDPWVKIHEIYNSENNSTEYHFSFEGQKKIGVRYTLAELKRLYSAAQNRNDDYKQKIEVIIKKAEKLINEAIEKAEQERKSGNYQDYFSPTFFVNPKNENQYIVGDETQVKEYFKSKSNDLEKYGLYVQERYFELE